LRRISSPLRQPATNIPLAMQPLSHDNLLGGRFENTRESTYPRVNIILTLLTSCLSPHSPDILGVRPGRGDVASVQTLQNSIVFTAAALAAKTVFGMGLALLLFRIVRFKRLIRGAVLLPFIVPTALSALVWWWMFEPLYSVVNWTLKSLHIIDHDIPWLPDPYLAMFTVILVNVWRGLPFFAITLLAGLVAIPRELYEAAQSDGAGPIACFWHITLPLLMPVLVVVILFSTIFTLSDFNIVYVLTRGGPMNMTHLFATYSFALGLQGGQIGQGAAVSLFLFPILLAVVFVQLRLVRKAALYE
jgi:multiple sugar transport system permease protein